MSAWNEWAQGDEESYEAGFVKEKMAQGTGERGHSLKAYSLLGCSEAWKRGEKWRDKIGFYGGPPAGEGWGRVC